MKHHNFNKVFLALFLIIGMSASVLFFSTQSKDEKELSGAAYETITEPQCNFGDNSCYGKLCTMDECPLACKAVYTLTNGKGTDLKVSVIGGCQQYGDTYSCKTKVPTIPLGFEFAYMESEGCKR